MKIFPAIDIKGESVFVFSKEILKIKLTEYKKSPFDQAKDFFKFWF